MASPPGATSPPGPSPLALPRQRPTLALPGGSSVKRRKPSLASNTSSAHPLRQTSFPPEQNLLDEQHQAALARFSPSQASQGSLEEFSDSEIVSAISGPTGGDDGSARKRKRGEKRTRGRSSTRGGLRAGSASLANGEEGTPATNRRGAASVMDNADDEDDDDDEDEGGAAGGGRMPLYEGGQMSAAEYETDNKQKAMFRQYMDMVDRQPISAPGRDGLATRDMRERYDAYNRAKLKTPDVRRLVNQTLSQSVPANVVTVVSAYTKTFAGLLIEEARKVQAEWMAVEEKRADGAGNPAYKRLKRTQEKITEKENGDAAELYPGGAGGLSTSIEECDRGPLQPDHLREALRRYKKSRKGGSVGFTGLSLEGREMAAPRMSGRRMFR